MGMRAAQRMRIGKVRWDARTDPGVLAYPSASVASVSTREQWAVVARLADGRQVYWCASGSRRGGQDQWSPRASQALRYARRQRPSESLWSSISRPLSASTAPFGADSAARSHQEQRHPLGRIERTFDIPLFWISSRLDHGEHGGQQDQSRTQQLHNVDR